MTIVPAPFGRSTPRPVLITGGCGFIGSNIADALAARGGSVLLLDNLARAGSHLNAKWLQERHGERIRIEKADTRDEAAVNSLVAGVSAVIHLAAQVAVTTSLEDPFLDFEVNARGTLNVLEAIRRSGKLIPLLFASTNKVYGKLLGDDAFARIEDGYAPINQRFAFGVDEKTPIDFHSPYGCSKGAADQYVRDYARVFGVPTAVLRMSCIYGPRQFGTEDQGWIAHFLISAIRGDPITIYGDGYQVRDALFIDDAVSAWLGVLDNIHHVSGRVFNLGGGPANAISLRQMIELIAVLRGESPRIKFREWRPGDQPWYVSDIRTISEATGWTSKTPPRIGVARLEEWLSPLFDDADVLPLAAAEARA
jgi:CDP-paratose 2-epimerase